tara:strand:+ start:30893 stop:31084 length:192 start_codon:yes stop_codon:yes gene_type:complete
MKRNKLKNIIKEKGLNPNQVAKATGLHKSTLYNHIKGFTRLGIDKALVLSSFLNIPLEDIYAD